MNYNSTRITLLLVFLLLFCKTSWAQQITIDAQLNSGIVASPILGGSSDQRVFGFRLQKAANTANTITQIVITTNVADATTTILEAKLFNVTSGSYVSSGANATISGNTITFVPNGPATNLTDFGGGTGNVDREFYVDITLKASATVLVAPGINFSLAASGITDTDPTTPTGSTITSSNFNIDPLTADFTQNADDATAVGGEQNVTLLAFSANSNGTQSITTPITITFDTDVNNILENFELLVGGVNVAGSETYSLNVAGTTLTIAAFTNIDVTNSTNFELQADIKPGVTNANDFVVSVTPSDFQINQGFVEAFSTFSNSVNVSALVADFTQNADASSAIGGQSGINLLSFDVLSNGTQSIHPSLVFTFNTDVTTILENFDLRVGGVNIAGSENYALTSGGTILTISGFTPESVSSNKTFSLLADVKAGATSSNDFSISLVPANVSVNAIGSVEAFGTFSNAIDVSALVADFTQNADAASALSGQADVNLLSFDVLSNGTQSIHPNLVFTFNTDVTNILENFDLQVGGVNIAGSENYALTSGGTILTISGFTPESVSSNKTFSLLADVKAGATSSNDFTISLVPANVSVNAIGSVEAFGTFSNAVDITTLAATLNAVATTPVIAGTVLEAGSVGTTNVLAGISMASNGSQVVNTINFNITGQTTQFTNFRLYRSTTGATLGSQIIATDSDGNFDLSPLGAPDKTLNATTTYYYLVGEVSNAVTTLSTSVRINPTETNVTLVSGDKTSFAFDKTYTFNTSQTSAVSVQFDGQVSIDLNEYDDDTDPSGSALTDVNTQQIFSFTITDADTDNKQTIINSITLELSNFDNLDGIALFDGTTKIAGTELLVSGVIDVDNRITFTGLSIAVNDGSTGTPSTKTISVKVTFADNVTDNEKIGVILFAMADDNINSGLTTFSNIQTNAARNNINVVSTEMQFNALVLPILQATDFGLTIRATDNRGNRDLDRTGNVTLNLQSGSGALSSTDAGALVRAFSSGLVSWSQLEISTANAKTIRATHGSLTSEDVSFTVTSLGIQVNGPANQSFCIGGDFQVLNSIVIDESDNGDFAVGTNVSYTIILPVDFVFRTDAAGIAAANIAETGTNINVGGTTKSFPANNIFRFTYTCSGTDSDDQITVFGLQVRYTGIVAKSASEILRIGGTAVQIGNSVDDAKPHGTISANTTSLPLDFTVSAGPNEPALSPGETRFSINTNSVILNPTVNGVSVNTGTFTGPGVESRFFGSPIFGNRFAFSPNSVGEGNLYPVTYQYNDPLNNNCLSTVTKSFVVYSSSIINLQSQYCKNDITPDNISVNTTAYPSAAYDVYDFVYYDRSVYNYFQTRAFPTFSSAVAITPTVIRITLNNHGFQSGDIIYIYDLGGFNGGGLSFRQYQIINSSLNTFDIDVSPYAVSITGAFDGNGSYYRYVIAGISNLGDRLRIRIPNHGFQPGITVSLEELTGFTPTIPRRDWIINAVINANVFEILAPAATIYSGSWIPGFSFVDYYLNSYRVLNGPLSDVTRPGFNSLSPLAVPAGNDEFVPQNYSSENDLVIGYRLLNKACGGVADLSNPTCRPILWQTSNVSFINPPTVDFTGISATANYCRDGSAILLTGSVLNESNPDGVFSGAGIADGGVGVNTASFDPTAGGVPISSIGALINIPITYTFTSSLGCVSSITKPVRVFNIPTVNPGANRDICEGTSTVLGGTVVSPSATGNGPFNFSWNNTGTLSSGTSSNPTANPIFNTTYTLTVTDAIGCVGSNNVIVTVRQPAGVEAGVAPVVCGDGFINLTGFSPAASFSGSATTANWTLNSPGSGFFADSDGDPVSAPYSISTAVRYYPSPAEIASGSVSFKLTTDDPPTVCDAVSDDVTVTINGVAIAEAGPATIEYCSGSPIVLNGFVGGSATSLTWTENGAGTVESPTIGSTFYLPSATELQNGATIRFTITSNDPPGPCNPVTDFIDITINQRAIIDAGPDITVCSGDVIALNGFINPALSSATSSVWSIASVGTGTIVTPSNLTTVYTPSPTELTNGVDRIVFRITSNKPLSPCPSETDDVNVRIYPIPKLPFAPQPNEYCVNDAILPLTASGDVVSAIISWYAADPAISPAPPLNTSSPFATGISSTNPITEDFFVTQTLYKTVGFDGCESPARQLFIVVNPLPQPSFTASNFCIGDFMQFDASSSSIATGSITQWEWNFRDFGALTIGPGGTGVTITGDDTQGGITGGTYNQPTHKYNSVGNYDVILKTTSNKGCVNTVSASTLPAFNNIPIEVGAYPVADFTWNKVCEDQVTMFSYTTPPVGPNMLREWDFGDPKSGIANLKNETTLAPITHDFKIAGSYLVKLTLTTNRGCEDDTVKTVNIAPHIFAELNDLTPSLNDSISEYPYQADFNIDSQGWYTRAFSKVSGTIPNSWSFYNSSLPAVFGTPLNGTGGWAIRDTNLQSYFNLERSALYSPCFSLNSDSLQRPVISLDYISLLDNLDGVYVEFSANDGATWNTLGNLNEGLNWYNRIGINGLSQISGVGQQVGQQGWTGASDSWKSAKLSLDNLVNAINLNGQDIEHVQFRIVFGSNNDNPIPAPVGFALNNFTIKSRNRTLLLENFTNSNSTNFVANNNSFRNFKQATSELVRIQYHTEIGGEDAINQLNPSDPNARAAFYGVTQSLRSYLDGKTDNLSAGDFTNLVWENNEYDSRTLAESPILISIDTIKFVKTVDPLGIAKFVVKVEVLENINPNSEYSIITALVQKNLNGESFVLRKFLPNAAGLKLKKFMNGDIQADTFKIDLFQFDSLDITKMAIISFVQEIRGNKEILQSSISDKGFDQIAKKKENLITSIEDFEGLSINVYPNPTSKNINIEFAKPIVRNVELKLIDNLGREIKSLKLKSGQNKTSLSVESYPEGLYYIKIPETKFVHKIMVVH
jgi:hypothetical protein